MARAQPSRSRLHLTWSPRGPTRSDLSAVPGRRYETPPPDPKVP